MDRPDTHLEDSDLRARHMLALDKRSNTGYLTLPLNSSSRVTKGESAHGLAALFLILREIWSAGAYFATSSAHKCPVILSAAGVKKVKGAVALLSVMYRLNLYLHV
ncbi:hypothetical protein Tco_1536421 [Tanacetum coccineum]